MASNKPIPTANLIKDKQLSPHFMASEFVCPCGCGLHEVSPRLVAGLETLRGKLGLPIVITSGYRCLDHNRKINGAKGSQHMLGTAADIVVRGTHPLVLYQTIVEIPDFALGGVGIGNGITHVDVRNGRTRWSYDVTGKEMPFARWEFYWKV